MLRNRRAVLGWFWPVFELVHGQKADRLDGHNLARYGLVAGETQDTLEAGHSRRVPYGCLRLQITF